MQNINKVMVAELLDLFPNSTPFYILDSELVTDGYEYEYADYCCYDGKVGFCGGGLGKYLGRYVRIARIVNDSLEITLERVKN